MHITKSRIERVHITGGFAERGKARAYCTRHGYTETFYGPQPAGAGRCKESRFVLEAERPAQDHPED